MSVDSYTDLSFPAKPGEHAAPTTDEIPVDFIPDYLRAAMKRESVVLANGSSSTLDPRLSDVVINFDWKFKEGVGGFDVDSSLAFFNATLTPTDFVWWDNKKTKCDSTRFVSNDNRDEESKESKESIEINLQNVPDNVQLMVLAVSVYSKDHSMEDISEISLKIDSSGTTQLSYQLSVQSAARSFLIGCFARKQAGWVFNAIAESLLSRTISEIMHEPANLDLISTFETVPIKRRHVTMNFVEGKNLTPMDFGILRKRSDPYLKIFIDDQVVISDVSYATLNPKIKCAPIDLGVVNESSTKVVEVQCWDWDRLTDHDNMGGNKFCLGGLMPKLSPGVNKVWLKMYPLEEHANSKKKITGDILCDIIVREV